MKTRRTLLSAILIVSVSLVAFAQGGGTLKGTVTLESKNLALHNAAVRIVQLGRTVDTKEDGSFEFTNVPPGTYSVVASMPAMNGASQSVTIAAGATATAAFKLELAPVRTQVTVTASGREQLTLQAFQTVTSLDALDLAKSPATSLGEALNNQPGVAKRSFGPGSSRPVIRGFDGDRVLVMQDSAPVGGLGFQSGDHAEPINTSTLERLEVLKGPATLLYGSNAIGGVVNAITSETDVHEHPHQGLQGFVTGAAGSNNNQGGGSASFSYGSGDWRLFGDAGGQRAGAYSAGDVEIENTQTHVGNGQFGIGRVTSGGFFSASGGYDKGLYGIAGEEATIDFRRHNGRFNGGIRRMDGPIQAFRATLGYTDWEHSEIEDGAIGTTLKNKQYTYRGVFEQRQGGSWSGSFGLSGAFRDYEAIGEEALSPPTTQKSFAGFILEEIGVGRVRYQLGGRFEHVGYSPESGTSRSFNGLSSGVGAHVGLWQDGAFVANFTTSYRAPALEELYNNGPHPGNLAFEIGDDTLLRERSNGIDLAIRHMASRVGAEANFFYYGIRNFVFLSPTGNVQDDLDEFNYAQGNSRFVGVETKLDFSIHPNLWVNLGLDSVNAKLTANNAPLPRIPPLRGHAGLDIRYKGLSVQPEVQMANAQSNTFTNETPTAGYSVFNLRGSYTIVQTHNIHVLSVNLFNMGDRVYSNHVSFAKDVAPEIGRGVNVTYSVRFF